MSRRQIPGRGPFIFSGPSGSKLFHTYRKIDPSYTGPNSFSPERTSDVMYLLRAPHQNAPHLGKGLWLGSIGWNVWSHNDWRLLKSDHQIKMGPFRNAAEIRFVNEGVY